MPSSSPRSIGTGRRRLRRGRVLAFAVAISALVATGCASNPYDDPNSVASRVERELEELEDDDTTALSDDRELPEPSTSPKPDTSSLGVDTTGTAGTKAALSSQERAAAAVSGKGQYLYRMEMIGTPAATVQRARQASLSHLIIRAGNPEQGFYVRDTLEELLPLAHEAGIKVVAYDGPAMEDIPGDVRRALDIVNYTTRSGDRIDALGADIERTRAPNLDRPRALEYARQLREAVGDHYPLVAIVMNPNYHESWYPFAELATGFDVLSPMDYWTGVTDDGAGFVAESIDRLAKYGKPVSVIGQAYPIEGAGSYPPASVVRDAMAVAKDKGAVGFSFWSWETTRADTWEVIATFGW